MNNSYKTQYKKVSSLKEGDYRQVGQWVRNPLNPQLSKLLVKHGDKPVYLHGERYRQGSTSAMRQRSGM